MNRDTTADVEQSEPPPRIFISGAIEGFRDERAQVKNELRALNLDPWVFEHKPASSQPLRESYLEYVRDSERVVWVIEGPPALAVVDEIREALLFEVPVLAFVLGELDSAAQELLQAAGGKYAPVEREDLVAAIKAAIVDEQRRGLRRPRMGRAATSPPAPPTDFVGRTAELAAVGAWLASGRHVVVNGLPGVGKSALALSAAADAQVDHVLYLDLRAADRPAPVERSMRRLLSGLGFPDKVIPSTRDELAAAWQDATERHRVLVVIDDVASEDEVRPLLPAGDGAALITTRHTVPELEAAKQLTLDELPQKDAVALLSSVLGNKRVGTEREAAAELHRLSGGLPLALRISAARLVTRPHWQLTEYVNRLADERERLEELKAGDVSVRASFNLSFALLAPEAQRAFSGVGYFRGPGFSGLALGAALDIDVTRVLEEVVDAQLLTSLGGDQYEVHDLLRLFAQEKQRDLDPEARKDEAGRLADHYRAQAAVRQLALLGREIDEAPLSWLDREMANVLHLCVQLAELGLNSELGALVLDAGGLYGVAHAWRSWDAILELAEEAARDFGDKTLQTKVALNRGIAALSYGDLDRAKVLLEQAEQGAKEAGSVADEARAVAQQATMLKESGDVGAAIPLTERALDLYRQAGDRTGEARSLGDLANQLDALGEHERALELHEQAKAVFREHSDQAGLAIEYGNTGIALMRLERFAAADEQFAASQEIHERLGARWYLAEIAGRRGEVAARMGDPERALGFFDRSIGLLESLDDPRLLADELGMRADVRRGLGDPNALEDAQRALEICEQIGGEYAIAVAQARIALHRGRFDEDAFASLERARGVFAAHRDRPHPAAVMAATHLAVIARIGGQPHRARNLFAEAADVAVGAHDPAGRRSALQNLARLEAEIGESEAALSQIETAREMGLDLPADFIAGIQALVESEIVVVGVEDELSARLISNAHLALERLDWEITDLRIVVAGPDRLAKGTNVNQTEIVIARANLPEQVPASPPEAAVQEHRLRFLIAGLVAVHLLMVKGVQSRGDLGSMMLEIGSAWFARQMVPDEFWPEVDDQLAPDDPYRTGEYLGAAYAGDGHALRVIRKVSPELAPTGEFERLQAEWMSLAPVEALRQLATGYSQAAGQ